MKVHQLFHTRLRRGDVGIEVEMEGTNLPQIGEHWNVERDGSLRGEAYEYVFNSPKTLSEAQEALSQLDKALTHNKSKVLDSGRAGVHVHVNCGSLSQIHLYNFMTLYFCLEQLLVEWCGESRVGNRFCLRGCDAEWQVEEIAEAARRGDERRRFARDDLRYASMNVKALPQYGSLEFRAMRCTRDMSLIYRWAGMLVGLRDHATSFFDPRDVVSTLSMGGGEAFVVNALGDFAPEVMSLEGWEEKLYDGVRTAQDLAFARDWRDLINPPRFIGGVRVDETFADDFPPTDV